MALETLDWPSNYVTHLCQDCFFFKTLNGFVHNSVVSRHYDIIICPFRYFGKNCLLFLPKKMIDQWSMTTELLLLFLCSYKTMFVASATCAHVCFHCYCYWRGLVEEFGKFMPLLIDCAAHKKGVPRCPESTGGGFWGGRGALNASFNLGPRTASNFLTRIWIYKPVYEQQQKNVWKTSHSNFWSLKEISLRKSFPIYPIIISLRFLTRHPFLHIIIIILIFRMLIIVGICKVWCEGSSHHSERTLGAQSTQIWIFY